MSGQVPSIDPGRERAPFRRAFDAFGTSSAGRWCGMNVASRIDPALLRLTGGRFATTSMLPLVVLRVPGRRSGELRAVPLVYFTDGEDVVLVASSFGRARHPAWYLNVLAHPEVELSAGGIIGRYRSREVEGPERERLYELARQNYSGYGDYEVLAGDRRIPVLALSPA